MASPAAQAIAAQGGEVVARASAYNDPYFATAQGRDQRAWADLIKARGRQVNYSIIQSNFHQIVADAFQRMRDSFRVVGARCFSAKVTRQ